MENNKDEFATEVWVLFRVSLSTNLNDGLWPLGVFDTREQAEIGLARNYTDEVETYDDGNIPDVFYIKPAHLCKPVPKST